jgi:ElaB/YqjD/DUF883 family membrane-anchored ribosome-binding protein
MPSPGSNAAAATAADLSARAHNSLDTAVDKVTPAVNRMVDKAHATIDRVAQAAVPAAEAVQTAVQKTTDQSARLMESATNSIRAQPLTAIGIAAAVGYLAGRLMR